MRRYKINDIAQKTMISHENKDTENKDLLVVGVNTNIEDTDNMNLGMKIDSGNEQKQISKLEQYRKSRNNNLVDEKLTVVTLDPQPLDPNHKPQGRPHVH